MDAQMEIDADVAKSLLLQYSEWLDVERINPSAPTEDDGHTHQGLVNSFLSQRHLLAFPFIAVEALDEYRGQ
ncbi:hypothetical protein PP713_13865 [Mycobacterium sp. CSUR Q5927]|nr:hypothetical protein [Mycobacterium sp. CSUR Q5927]